MSLRSIVAFAQAHFAGPSLVPDETSSSDSESLAPKLVDAIRRPQMPHWLRQPASGSLIPLPSDHRWKISGPIDRLEREPDPQSMGIDTLAFYLPFHFYRTRWGIYVRSSGVAALARVLKGVPLTLGDEEYLYQAHEILFEHELFHAAAEIACARAEIVCRVGLYHPYYAHGPAAEHEEALANASAVRPNDDRSAPIRRLMAWMRRGGPGYREFHRWTKSSSFSRGLSRAAHHIVAPLPAPKPSASGPPLDFLFRGYYLYNVPTTEVVDEDLSGLSLLRPFPRKYGIQVLVHSNDHNPPHIHISVSPDEPDTRYAWPSLTPLKSNPALPRSKEKSLHRYIEEMRDAIEERVQAVYGT